MDLKNNKIKMGEIFNNPEAKKILEREFPEFTTPFMLRMAKNMSLDDVLRLAKGRVPQAKIDRTVEELKRA